MDCLFCYLLCFWFFDLLNVVSAQNILMFKRMSLFCYGLLLSTVCLVNKYNLIKFHNEKFDYFMKCYFNDILGTIVFLLYLSIVLSFLKKDFRFRLIDVILITVVSGLLWEYVTPLYREDTVSDPWDLVAYLFGGICFWGLVKVNPIAKNDNHANLNA